ncbi:MAG: DUF1501 domain-containing protein [Gemmataceae bacterium]
MRDMIPELGLTRRDFAKLSAAGVLGAGMSGWLDILATRAAEQRQQNHKACILLWMDGGPSHKDTFDLKPGTEHAGEFSEINTNVAGIKISEHLPKIAQVMNRGALIRGMSTGEGAHGRAKHFMHTGYREGVGGLAYPSIGSIASDEIGDDTNPLPNYVCIGNTPNGSGSGFLGAAHQPLVVRDPARGVENLAAYVERTQMDNRLGLLQELESGFNRTYQSNIGAAHRTTYQRAVSLMRDRGRRAFDVTLESEQTRRRYGTSRFGQSCLMARRLVEAGVSFVEVTLGGWDTHQRNWDRVRQNSAQIDPAINALVNDLRTNGKLDDTLIVWMGEFGRTPRINTRGNQPGRDHYPRAWTSAMWGGGIRGGQVIGATDAEGARVTERPVSAIDFLATVCSIIGIDYTKFNNTRIGRPIRLVDRGANPIRELVPQRQAANS